MTKQHNDGKEKLAVSRDLHALTLSTLMLSFVSGIINKFSILMPNMKSNQKEK